MIADIVKQSAGYCTILVTGPQRSGTHIAARILAAESKRRYVPESEIECNNMEKLFTLILSREPVCIQAPCLSAICHLLPCFVVFMRRPIDEIIASQKRIGWNCGLEEKRRYFVVSPTPAAEIKYEMWEEFQFRNQPNMTELKYHDLESHPLWVAQEKRKQFLADQTE